VNLTRTAGPAPFLAVVAMAAALLAFAVPSATARPTDPGAFGRSHRPVCGPAPKGAARCHSDVVTDAQGDPLVTPAPDGYGPSDLQGAYNIFNQSSSAGGTQTIAIVDAYDDPNAEADLGVYRSQYGLPPCTTANGCFKKVNQLGQQGNYPKTDAGWAQEISLDLDMASAICPNCKILLVEANSNFFSDLATAVDRAATLGGTQISNSYGGSEYSGETSDESHYNHPGVAVTVSSGDSGYGAEFPAASRYVTAVGGTTLNRNSSTPRGWTETAWSGAGSGCSAYISKPAWQSDSGCTRRTIADVSAVADPNTGVAVYDSLPFHGRSGWMVFGGTSAAAPIVAGFDALIGSSAGSPSYPYGNPGSYYDITSGSNGSCGGSYLCTAKAGFDGPTGLGTPKGSGGTPPNQPPSAAFTISPNPAQTGETVTFNGAGSSDDGTISKYEWDLDGNGSFETDTGATSSTTKSYATAQSISVKLRVTDNLGATSVVSHQLTVNSPTNQAPTASFTMSPNPAQSGQAVSFDGSGSTDPEGTTLTFHWDFGDGATDSGATIQHTYSTGVTTAFTVTLTVTDNASGVGSTSHTLQVTPVPGPAGSASSGGPTGGTTGTTTTPSGAGTGDVVRPNVSSLRVSPFAFHAARRGPAVLARIATGTRVSFVLSERANLTFRIQRARAGRLVGRRCVAVTRRNRSARHCTRYLLLAAKFTRVGRAGANSFRYMGRLAGHPLRLGRYRLLVTAADAAGNRSLVRRVAFRIV
jgi:PKD repeat protein